MASHSAASGQPLRCRLGPDHPAPAAVEDAYAGLCGLAERAGDLNIDIDRIAIGGANAGGGIAAALALLAHDRAEIRPVFQLLLYPMLDDRTTTRTDLDTLKVRVWTPKSNRYGWSSYLGDAVAGPDVSPYAAAARREDLTGRTDPGRRGRTGPGLRSALRQPRARGVRPARGRRRDSSRRRGTEHLPRLIGRDRALEAILSSDDYDADTAERYGWVTRAVADAELDGFVDGMATRP